MAECIKCGHELYQDICIEDKCKCDCFDDSY